MSLFRRRRPEPPRNVRVTVNGTVIPVECVYVGRVREGREKLDVWRAVTPVHVEGQSVVIEGDLIPRHSRIELTLLYPCP